MMRCFFDERQRRHAPASEFFNGALHPAAESQARVDAILSAIGSVEGPKDHGTDPLLRVHAADYLDFLRTAFADWRDAGREGDAFPYTFPLVGRRPLSFDRQSEGYARAELVAEMGAAMLCGVAGIDCATVENQAAYLDHWISVLKGDHKLAVQAAAAAQKAADRILGRTWEE